MKFVKKIFLINLYRSLGFPFVMPYKYIFLLTNICQSRCLTCNIWKIYRSGNGELLKRELSTYEYGKIFEKIKKDVLWLNFSGGEPFLRKDLVDLTRLAFKKFKNMIVFNMPTNGLETELIKEKVEEILEFKEENVKFFLTVSLDGPEYLNDKIRGVKGSYKRVRKTYNTLKKLSEKYKNFFVSFQSTISKYNINNYKEVFDEIKYTYQPIIAWAHENVYFNNIGLNINLTKVEKEKILKAIKYFHKNYPLTSLYNFIPKIFLKLAEKYYNNPKRLVLPCFASFATITIDAYGNVKPCSYFTEAIANLRDFNFDIKKILKTTSKAKIFRENVKHEKCPHCWANCEAYPSMIHNFPLTFIKLFSKK
ncbi:MAG: radical SAM protein [Candidatus Aenigmatarchaeota archaeon]